jgi:hypothetical protein
LERGVATVHVQDRTAAPTLALYPYYYSRRGRSVSVVGGRFPGELGAEVLLFLRKQLAFYEEHEVQPRKLTYAVRFSLALWSQLFNWRAALVVVKPETLIGWHRKGFKLGGRWKSRLGRPADCTRISAGEGRRVRSNALSADYNCKIILSLP